MAPSPTGELLRRMNIWSAPEVVTHLGFEVIPNQIPEKVFSDESHLINSVRTTGQPEVQIPTPDM